MEKFAAAEIPQINCTVAITDPVDAHPVRSPQAVHSAVARHSVGQQLVEIGTRSGDGMACFAQVAKSAIAVEMDPPACKNLAERSRLLGEKGNRTFAIECQAYQKLTLDADVFTWWQQEPVLKNFEVLSHLRRQQVAGGIRQSAMAILLFENGFEEDMRTLRTLRSFASWLEEVPFDEVALCKKRYRRKPWFWKRSRGSYHVMGLRIANVPANLAGVASI